MALPESSVTDPNPANSTAFTYEPLPDSKKYIRLVQIRDNDDDHAPVSCRTKTRSIKKAGKYDAISYVWGDPAPIDEITVNDQTMLVGQNCAYALRQRRHIQKPGVWTWIDSICINQSDLEEKGKQVGIMGAIYRNAEGVFASLVERHSNAERVMRYIQCRYPVRASIEAASRLALTSILYSSDEILDYRAVRQAFHDFCHEEYWHRVWVVPELKLAKRMQVMYGRLSVDSVSLRQCIDHDSVGRFSPMGDMFRAIDRKGRIQNEMAWLANLRCFDPRDRIYAMIEVFSWNAHGHPLVDYNKHASRLATDVLLLVGRDQDDTALITDPFRFAVELLQMLEVPIKRASDMARLFCAPSASTSSSHASPQQNHQPCHCPQPSMIHSAFRREGQMLAQIRGVRGANRLRHDIMTCEVLLEVEDDHVPDTLDQNENSCLRWYKAWVGVHIVPGDYLALTTQHQKDEVARYLVIRVAREGLYQIVGLALCARFRTASERGPTVTLLVDTEDLVTFARSAPGGSLRTIYDVDWLSTNAFCRKPFSSCAISRDQMPIAATNPSIHPVCAECGLWIVSRNEHTELLRAPQSGPGSL